MAVLVVRMACPMDDRQRDVRNAGKAAQGRQQTGHGRTLRPCWVIAALLVARLMLVVTPNPQRTLQSCQATVRNNK